MSDPFNFNLSSAQFAKMVNSLKKSVKLLRQDPDNNMVLTEVFTFDALIEDRGGNSQPDASGLVIDRNRWKIRVIDNTLSFEKGDTLELPSGERVFVNHIRSVKNLLSLFADSERIS